MAKISPLKSIAVVVLMAGAFLGGFVGDRIVANRFQSITSQPAQLPPYSGVLVVQAEDGQGSCFVVAQRGEWKYAITAGHVVETGLTFTVDEELYDAEVVKIDSNEDVALIRFKSSETYKMYSFAEVEVGESCTAVGWSRGSKLVYRGYIVSVDFDGFVAANGGVVPGCSGGVLLNEKNEAIGVTVAVPVYSYSAFDSTALYVPIRFAEALVITIK